MKLTQNELFSSFKSEPSTIFTQSHFQVAFSCNTNVEYQIWSYSDKRIRIHTHTHIHRQTATNVIFWIQGKSKRVNPSKWINKCVSPLNCL